MRCCAPDALLQVNHIYCTSKLLEVTTAESCSGIYQTIRSDTQHVHTMKLSYINSKQQTFLGGVNAHGMVQQIPTTCVRRKKPRHACLPRSHSCTMAPRPQARPPSTRLIHSGGLRSASQKRPNRLDKDCQQEWQPPPRVPRHSLGTSAHGMAALPRPVQPAQRGAALRLSALAQTQLRRASRWKRPGPAVAGMSPAGCAMPGRRRVCAAALSAAQCAVQAAAWHLGRWRAPVAQPSSTLRVPRAHGTCRNC